jgi:hypothetical protein
LIHRHQFHHRCSHLADRAQQRPQALGTPVSSAVPCRPVVRYWYNYKQEITELC